MARNIMRYVRSHDNWASAMSLLPRITTTVIARSQHTLCASSLEGLHDTSARFICEETSSTAQQFDSGNTATPGCARLLGPFSNTQALPAPVALGEEGGATEPTGPKREGIINSKRRVKRTLIEVLRMLPNWGVGASVAKNHWQPGNFYKVTIVKANRGKSGKVWGIFHNKAGSSAGKEDKVGGVGKPGWKEVKSETEEVNWNRA